MKQFIITLITFLAIATVLFAQGKRINLNDKNSGFIQGVDISELLKIEDHGGVFIENGIQKDALEIFKDHHINYVRLRLWHTPGDGYCNLDKTLLMAQRIKDAGLKFMLDFHYSDTWADPGHQAKPGAWGNLSFQALEDSIHTYTSHVIAALKNQNTLPDIVQIGNEITCGMLWDDGRICAQYNSPSQWKKFGSLVNHAIAGVKDCLTSGDSVKIMIHIDCGGNNTSSRWFFDNLLTQNVDFDIIGLSYYPWWHGTFGELEYNTRDLAGRYHKDIIIVETAYPWTLGWYDNTHNIVGDSSQLLPDYPASVEGQKEFLVDLIDLVKNIPDEKGLGLFYWAPEWVSTAQSGSPWENMTLFDFYGEMLDSITAFDSTCVDTPK